MKICVYSALTGVNIYEEFDTNGQLARWILEYEKSTGMGNPWTACKSMLASLESIFQNIITETAGAKILNQISFLDKGYEMELEADEVWLDLNPFLSTGFYGHLAFRKLGDMPASGGTHAPSAFPNAAPTPPATQQYIDNVTSWFSGLDASELAPPSVCTCSMADLMSVGHNPSCPEKK